MHEKSVQQISNLHNFVSEVKDAKLRKELESLLTQKLDLCKKLIAQGTTTSEELIQLGERNPKVLKVLLKYLDVVVRNVGNRISFKQIMDLGDEHSAVLPFFLRCYNIYNSYILRNFTTFDKLLELFPELLFDGNDLNSAFVSFGKYNESIEKLLDAKVPFNGIYKLGKDNYYSFEILLKDVDAAIYLIQNKYLTFKQISRVGVRDYTGMHPLEALLKHHKAYVSYISRGLVSFKTLLKLASDSGDYNVDIPRKEFFRTLGKYKESIDKLLEFGISLQKIYRFGMIARGFSPYETLAQNVDKAIYLMRNKHFTFEQLTNVGKVGAMALPLFFEYHDTYIKYVSKNLTTYKSLLTLTSHSDLFGFCAFITLGEYGKSVDELLKLGVSFDALCQLGKISNEELKALLKDINFDKSQEWINAHSIVLQRQEIEKQNMGVKFLVEVDKLENTSKKRLCILNGLSLLNFTGSSIAAVDAVLKLPLAVLKEFDSSKDNKILLENKVLLDCLIRKVEQQQLSSPDASVFREC